MSRRSLVCRPGTSRSNSNPATSSSSSNGSSAAEQATRENRGCFYGLFTSLLFSAKLLRGSGLEVRGVSRQAGRQAVCSFACLLARLPCLRQGRHSAGWGTRRLREKDARRTKQRRRQNRRVGKSNNAKEFITASTARRTPTRHSMTKPVWTRAPIPVSFVCSLARASRRFSKPLSTASPAHRAEKTASSEHRALLRFATNYPAWRIVRR